MRWFLALAFAGAFAFQAQAQTSMATGLACDTKEQVEIFVREMASGKTHLEALDSANKQDKQACGIITVAYQNEEVLGAVSIQGRQLNIISFLVVGVNSGSGLVPIKPSRQFGLRVSSDRGA